MDTFSDNFKKSLVSNASSKIKLVRVCGGIQKELSQMLAELNNLETLEIYYNLRRDPIDFSFIKKLTTLEFFNAQLSKDNYITLT